MMQHIKRNGGFLTDRKGFTLIEMAIVLIIIGIIIGAIIKGKDVVKSAEQKKLYTQYLREWQVAFNSYYDRAGLILADQTNATNDAGGVRNGQCDDTITEANLNAQLTNVGLTPPAAGPTGLTTVRTYTDSTGVLRTLTLQFDYKTDLGNIIRVTGIPSDLGIAWDRIVDGQADGTTGDLLFSENHGPAAQAGQLQAWPPPSTAPDANDALILRLQF
jgi:prepilin-type N-terminal cleavage/methylation domain-containing protein